MMVKEFEGHAFAQPYAVDRLAARGEASVRVRAEGEAALAAIAERLRIPAVKSLAVDWTLRPGTSGTIDATGVLEARVVQDCVVTLEPFEAAIAERFAVVFVPEGDIPEEVLDEDPDAPDVIGFAGRALDLGEAAVEQLALALDPFPRKPGASLAQAEEEAAEAPARPSPFAVLASRRTPEGS